MLTLPPFRKKSGFFIFCIWTPNNILLPAQINDSYLIARTQFQLAYIVHAIVKYITNIYRNMYYIYPEYDAVVVCTSSENLKIL